MAVVEDQFILYIITLYLEVELCPEYLCNLLQLIHFQVTENDHRYLKNEEMREESGTPAIVESIRAGLVFQLKRACGVQNIMEKEHDLTKFFFLYILILILFFFKF